MNQKIKSHLITAAVVALCIAFSWSVSDSLYTHHLTNVDQISYSDGFLGGIDVLEQSYVVFQVDLRTGEDRYLEVPKIINQESCTLSHLQVLESGEIWLVREYTRKSKDHRDLVRCDFDRGELEAVIHLEDLTDRLFYTFSSIYGRPYVFLYDRQWRMERYEVKNRELVYLDTPVMENNADSRIFAPSEDGSIFEIYRDGWIYRQDKEGKAEPVIQIGGSKEEGWDYDYQFYRDCIRYENSKTGEWMEVDLTRKPYIPVPCEPTCRPAESFDESRMTGEYFDNGKVKCGKLSLVDGRRVPAVCGTYDQVIERLSQDEMAAVFRVVASVMYILFFLAIRAVWRTLKKKHIVIPLVAYAAALTLLLMFIGISFIQELVSRVLQENMEENNYGACIQLGYESMDRYWLDNIQAMCAYPEITPLNRLPYSYDLSAYQRMAFRDIRRGHFLPSGIEVDFRVYFRKEGEIYPLEDDLYIVNTPLAYNMSPCDFDAIDAMERAIREQKVVTLQYEDLAGREYSAFIPFGNQGEYPLLLEVAMPQKENNRRIARQQIAMEKLLTLIAAVLAGAILLVIWISMKPLRSLKEAALNITRGRLEARAYARGRSEAAVTAVYFNQMADQIAAQVSGSSAYQKKYEEFAPLWLLEAVGKGKRPVNAPGREGPVQDGAGSRLPGVRQEYCAVMSVKLLEEGLGAAFQLGEIHRHGGEALSFEDGETWCVFPHSVEDALDAAMGMVKPFREGKEVRASIGLDYDEVRLGIIGNDSRSALEAFMAGRGRARFLQSCGEKYGTPVLLTQPAADQIPDVGARFHLRLLGRFWFEASGKAEKVYEVLDGECMELYQKKLLTNEWFQKGRQAFEEGDFPAARTAFVRVLAENQRDKAALHYIRLCDERLNSAGRQNPSTGKQPKADRQGCMEIY